MNAQDARVRAEISRIAANWFAAHRTRKLDDSERAEFLAWLKASPLHVEEYLGVAAIERTLAAACRESTRSAEDWVRHARSADHETVTSLDTHAAMVEPTQELGRASAEAPAAVAVHRGRRAALRWAVAASVTGLAVVLVRGQWHAAAPPIVTTVSTLRGEQRTLTLADGSTLRANTDTTATVRISPTERVVDLQRGEVSLEVAHDTRRPLHVRAGSTDAVAVGTAFDVYHHADSTAVTVMKGQVLVAVSRRDAVDPGAEPPREATPHSLRINPGQRVTVVGGVLPPLAEVVDLREATAWLEGKIVFERKPLGAVAEEFNRYNEIQFSIADPAVRAMTISGSFASTDPDSFAAFLESLDGVTVRRAGDRIVVSRARSSLPTGVRRS